MKKEYNESLVKNEETVNLLITEPDIMVFTDRNGEDILRIKPNGDILRRGELIENNTEVVDALKDFLSIQGYVL